MKKTTFFNSDENRIEKAKRWLHIVTVCFMCFIGQFGFAQFAFPPIVGPTNVPGGTTGVTLNVNNAANTAAVTAGIYDSFTLTVNWVDSDNAYSSEAAIEVTTASGTTSLLYSPQGLPNGNSATLTFSADFNGFYNPDVDGTLNVKLRQTWTASSAVWNNIVITLNPAPTCITPVGLVSSGITPYTAGVSWDESASSTAVGYEYFLSTTNTVPTGAGTATVDGNPFVELDNLTPQTVYYFFVRTDCGSGEFSEWSASHTFTTTCVPVVAFPYLETFNTFLPSICWQLADNGDLTNGPATFGSSNWVADGFDNVATTGAIRYNLYLASANDWILSPQFTIPAVGYELKFDAAAFQWASTSAPSPAWEDDDFVQVLVSTNGTTNWEVLYTYDSSNVPSTSGTFNVIDLDDYAGETVRFAFRAVEGTSDGATDLEFMVDNFQIRQSPLCPDQTGLVVSGITFDGASTSWDDMSESGAIGYEYAVTTSATPPTSGTLIEDTFYSASGLASNTVHYLHVRTSCGGSDYGIWATKSFRTACTAFTEFSENFDSVTTPGLPSCWGKILSGATLSAFATVGTSTTNVSAPNGVDLYNSNTGAADNIILVTPTLSNLSEGTHRLKFKARNTTASQDLQIGVLTDVADASTFTLVQDVDITTTFQDYVVNFDEYTGPGVAIGIRRLSTSTYTNVYLDDIVWEAMPTCPDQTGLVVGSITSDGAATSWDDMSANGVTSYEYAVTTSATPPASGTDTTDPFYLATGLDADTAYYLHVRTSCGAGNFGIWVTKAFRTTCTAFTVPYFEGFETGYTHNAAVAGCWTQESVTGTQVWRANNTFTDYNRSPRTGAWNAFLQWSNEDWMFIPVQLEGGVEYELKFYARQDGTVSADSSVKASYGASNSVAGMTNVIVPATGIVNGSYQLISGLLTPSTTGVYYIGINGYMNGNPWYISIDDISLDLAPTCPNVTGLVVGSVTYNSASVSWDDMEVDGYEYAVTTSSTPPTSGDDITVTFDSVSDLASNTLHYLHVRTVCGSDFGSWMTVSFTTLVAPSAVPWTEGFALVAVPTGWTGSGYTIDLASASIGFPAAAKFGDGQTSIIRRNPWISSPTGNFSTNSAGLVSVGDILSFDYKLINYDNANQPAVGSGRYKVEVSTDFGATYTEIDEVVNDGVAGWQTKTYPLDDYEGEYVRVKITDTWTSGDYFIGFDNFFIGPELSSPSFDKSALKVYPNPTKNILYVNYNQEISNVEVYNLVGQRVANITPNANEGQIDMSNLASGAYFVKVTSNNATRTVKVIKE